MSFRGFRLVSAETGNPVFMRATAVLNLVSAVSAGITRGSPFWGLQVIDFIGFPVSAVSAPYGGAAGAETGSTQGGLLPVGWQTTANQLTKRKERKA